MQYCDDRNQQKCCSTLQDLGGEGCKCAHDGALALLIYRAVQALSYELARQNTCCGHDRRNTPQGSDLSHDSIALDTTQHFARCHSWHRIMALTGYDPFFVRPLLDDACSFLTEHDDWGSRGTWYSEEAASVLRGRGPFFPSCDGARGAGRWVAGKPRARRCIAPDRDRIFLRPTSRGLAVDPDGGTRAWLAGDCAIWPKRCGPEVGCPAGLRLGWCGC